jgi:hypothetical protein
MPIIVEKLVSEPIIVLKLDAQVSLQELIDAWFRSAELTQTMDTTPYRIVDLRSTTDPNRIVSMIQSIAKGASGVSVKLSLNVAFIGNAACAASVGSAEACFETLEDALNHVRALAGAPIIVS